VSGSPARRPGVEDLVDACRAGMVAAGMFAGHPVTSVARMFFTRVGAGGGPACRGLDCHFESICESCTF
jgi:hypothetical protein